MAVWKSSLVFLWATLSVTASQQSSLPLSFLPTGIEYEYSYRSSAQLYGNINVTLDATVSVRALPGSSGTQGLVLSASALELTWTTSSGAVKDNNPIGNVTKWFSVLRESSGAISTVLYPPSESASVLAFKKALAKLLSTNAAFSEREEDGSNSVFTWEWVEGGGDGVREKHVRKEISLDEAGAIFQIKVDEKISPPEISRKTDALLDGPIHSHSTLLLIAQHSSPSTSTLHRPDNLVQDDITITSVRPHLPLPTLTPHLPSLLHCATHDTDCRTNLREAIKHLSDDDITILAQQYFNEDSTSFSLPEALALLSALSTSHSSPFTTHLLTSLLLPSPGHHLPHEELLSKALFYFATSLPPDELAVERVWSLVLERSTSPAIQQQALLTLGAMAGRVRGKNSDLAASVVANLHHLLELHTGHLTPHTLHKYRRSTSPTLPTSLSPTKLHSLLLDCLANAGADESFPTLLHYSGGGELSVRHSAIRGLRNYDSEESAEALLSITQSLPHPSLTQAAASAYQAHPRRKRDLSHLLVPSSAQSHSRSRRQASDDAGSDGVMNVTMPAVGWHRDFGESNISADISRTMFNSFSLETAPLSSQYHFSLHDETLFSAHLSLSEGDTNFDMMRTQLCLEGTVFYDDVDILTEFTPNLTYQQHTLFSAVSGELVEEFETAYDLLVASDASYNGLKEGLNNELDNLMDIHFEDVATHLNGTLSRLDALSASFVYETEARAIHSAIWDSYTSSRTMAQNSLEAITSALDSALPSQPAELQQALTVEGQPFTTHSFHLPYLPFAPQKALANILDIHRSSEERFTQLQTSVQSVIDLTSAYGLNHAWISPGLQLRQVADDLTALTLELERAINIAQKSPSQSYDGASLSDLRELYSTVTSDLQQSLESLVGVADDLVIQSSHFSDALSGTQQAFAAFTLAYGTARSTVDSIFGQRFHPSFLRKQRSCDHSSGCGSYPTSSGGYGVGVALVASEGEEVVAPLSGYYQLFPSLPPPYDTSTTLLLTPTESSYHNITFILTHILPSSPLTTEPTFIKSGDPLGTVTTITQNSDDSCYIHMEAYKTISNETYTIDPSQFLQPILEPEVRIEYECNDLVTYVGSTVADRRSIAADDPELVSVGVALVEDTIPGHEFPQPVDRVVRSSGEGVVSGDSVVFFSSSTFLMVGTIPVQFDFMATGEYQIDYSLTAALLSRQLSLTLTPSLSTRAQGEVRVGGTQYATVRLEGTVLEASLPLELREDFLQWPLIASSQMDLALSPSSLSLTSQLSQITGAGEFAGEEVLQTETLWYYTIPPLNRDEFYYQGSLIDETPAEFAILPYAESECFVRQLPLGDYSNPIFEVEFNVIEPQGLLHVAYQTGSAPKGDDIIPNTRLGGDRIVVPHPLFPSQPIHVTVRATNLNGQETFALCTLPSYDRSPPLARITPIRPVSSHPSKIAVLFSLFDEYGLDTPLQVAVGTVPGVYGSDVMDWVNFDLSDISTPPPEDGNVLNLFSFKRTGRLVTRVTEVLYATPTVADCAQTCVNQSDCLSFDYSPNENTCILHNSLEGPSSDPEIENTFETPPLQILSDYSHYEKLGTGNSTVLEFSGLTLEHNTQYYINMRLVNGLQFTSVASSTPFLVDLTPPTPGHIRSSQSNVTVVSCGDLAVDTLDCIEESSQPNHWVIRDGPGSAAVFNGPSPLVDAMYTSTSNYITAHWDGIDDAQSGLHTFQWWVGTLPGRDDVILPTDPHMLLSGGRRSWTNTGLVTGLELTDGSYYVSVRAISSVEYGGALVTTVEHSTPYTLDTSPPVLTDMIITEYDTLSSELIFSYDASDPQSGLRSVSLSLGRTELDTAILGWTDVGTGGNGTVTVVIPDGVDTWVKLRATNNAGLQSVAVSETPVRVDRSPPVIGQFGDGDDVMIGDVDYQSDATTLCIHGHGISDPESGIADILWAIGTTPGGQNIQPFTSAPSLLSAGSACSGTLPLTPDSTYYSTLSITNGAINPLTTTVTTDGVYLDISPPLAGTVHTGSEPTLDSAFSSSITEVAASWEDFVDYESGIAQYTLRVLHQPLNEATYTTITTETVDGMTTNILWSHFSFSNGDSIIVEVEAMNGAGRSVAASSNAYSIDLSPPHVNYVSDGNDPMNELSYQSEDNHLVVSWDAVDNESGIVRVEVAVLEQREGRRMQVYPNPLVSSEATEEINVAETTINISLPLSHSSKYITVLTFTNGAGLKAQYESNGIIIDTSPPIVEAVTVLGGMTVDDDSGDTELTVTSTEELDARWRATDPDSGVAEVLVGVVDENLTYVGPGVVSFESQPGGILENLELTPFAQYRVAVVVINNAQLQTGPIFSEPFRVVPGDGLGIVYDGEDPQLTDTDYTDEATAITAHFSGFDSPRCGGVYRYEWAVGEEWEGEGRESVMGFTDSGIVVTGTNGSGYAQVLLPDLERFKSQPLYITVKGFTGCEDVLESTSNGFIIDPSPPTIEILGTGENAIERAQSAIGDAPINHTIYQTTPSFSSLWEANDIQSGLEDSVLVKVGTYPGGSNVLDSTTSTDHLRTNASGGEGLPHYVTVQTTNRAGVSAVATGDPVVLDTTAPTLGELYCSTYGYPNPLPLPQSLNHTTTAIISCQWMDITDPESGIRHIVATITNPNTEQQELLYTAMLPGSSSSFQSSILTLDTEEIYSIALEVTNGAGLERVVTTLLGGAPGNYTGYVQVVANFGHTVNESGVLPDPKRMSGDDAVCLWETDVISIVFSATVDAESVDSESYKIGVGFSPGSDNHHPFTSFTPTLITPGTYAHTLSPIDTTTTNGQAIFITVQAAPQDNTRTQYSLTSPPVFIKSDTMDQANWITDGPDPNSDLEYQISTTEISGYFGIGSNCPLIYARWAVQDTNGTVVQEYTDIEVPSPNDGTLVSSFYLFSDQVRLYEEESYRILVQAVDYSGEVVVLRSNGLTVTTDALVPSVVQDGPIIGQDLNYQEPTTYLSAHWTEFGDGTPQQEIAYYEIAAGSDRGYPNTRSDIAPFTNIGLNTTHTFTNLDLIPETVVYYVTVRAYAISGASVESTSNGIRVGLTHSVVPGEITLVQYQSDSTTVSAYWSDFVSDVPIRTYEWAIGEQRLNSDQLQEVCREYASTFAAMFEVLPFTLVNFDTAAAQSGLNLTHNTTYYVTVRGIDEANKCVAVTSSPMLVDLTDPIPYAQGIRVGPTESLIGIATDSPYIVYIQPDTDLRVSWEEYSDPESDIEYYEVGLFEQVMCGSNDVVHAVSSFANTGLGRWFVFEQPGLLEGVPYVVEVRATNFAGLTRGAYSQPILLDSTPAVPGTVKDGLEWESDVTYQSDLSLLSGVFSHTKLPPQYPGVVLENDPCPNTTFHSLTTPSTSWSTLTPNMVIGIDSSTINYNASQVTTTSSGLSITSLRDPSGKVLTGAYETTVDMSEGGVVSLDILAAMGSRVSDTELEDQSVTSVVFVASPTRGILTEFEYELRDTDYPTTPSVNSVGLQIHHSFNGMNSQKIVLWSKSDNPLDPLAYVAQDISHLSLSEMHTYTLDFQQQRFDMDYSRWVDLYIDGEIAATLHGIAPLSNSTRAILHVFNREGFVPNLDNPFEVPTVVALFANVTLPRQTGHICDNGRPFYSATSPIVQFSIGVGTTPGDVDIRDFEELSFPCQPCVPGPCSSYACSLNCTNLDPYTLTFTLHNLTLSPGYYTNQSDAPDTGFEFENSNTANTMLSLFSNHFQPATYYIAVQAITASGQQVISSSNGVTIDTTPPEIITPIDHFDVSFSTVQPTNFQASNDTIAVRWTFQDLQSGITEYQWSIGTTPYGSDVQPFVSVGTNTEASNSNLLGILEHNTTYYVTVVAVNGAGLRANATSSGVLYTATVLNGSALQGVVTVESLRSVGVRGENGSVVEVLVVEVEDRAAIGWEGVPEDVEDIFWYIGSGTQSTESEDIFPRTRVNFNSSTRAELSSGILFLDGTPFANISEIFALAEGTSEESVDTQFVLEPGRLFYHTVELCNFVHRCVAVDTSPSVLIRPKDVTVTAATEEEDITLTFTQTQGQSTEVTDRDYTITIDSAGGLEEASMLVAGFLNHSDLVQKYRVRVPYISNPYLTMAQTSREIARRFTEVGGPSFFVSFLGQDSLNGVLMVNVTFDPFLDRTRFTPELAYWDIDEEVWREVSATCGEPSVVDWDTFTISAEMCSTVLSETSSRPESLLRRRRQATPTTSGSGSGDPLNYLDRPTQFIVMSIGNFSTNTPPQLLLPADPLVVNEGESITDYQLEFSDTEGDVVDFYLASPPLGVASVTLDGLLLYTPCQDCTGVDTFEIYIIEQPFGINNAPMSASGQIVIEVLNVNNNPSLYAYDASFPASTNVTMDREVVVYIDSNRTEPVSIAQIAALDVDGYFDDLSISIDVQRGTGSSEIWLDAVNVIESLPLSSPPNDDFSGYITFVGANITYLPPGVEFVGSDIVKVGIQDTQGAPSETLTINVTVVPSWCQNNGVCGGSSVDPDCSDVESRRSNPESYNCSCRDGFSGQFCEEDLRVVEPVVLRECPNGIPLVTCDGDPCTDAVCPSERAAVCRPNYCGSCRAEWFIGDTLIQCNADPPDACFHPTDPLLCRETPDCDCPEQPYPCPSDSVLVETRHSDCCVTYECQCPDISCPLLMEGGLGLQPVPEFRGNKRPGRCCPEYSFEDINECEVDGDNMCSDICSNKDFGYNCSCPAGTTLSQDGYHCGVCMHDGREFLYGDRVQIGCNWCICQSDNLSAQRWHCTANTCERGCRHNGVFYQPGQSMTLTPFSCSCQLTDSNAEWSCSN